MNLEEKNHVIDVPRLLQLRSEEAAAQNAANHFSEQLDDANRRIRECQKDMQMLLETAFEQGAVPVFCLNMGGFLLVVHLNHRGDVEFNRMPLYRA